MFVCLNPLTQARLRLVCFPYAGGGPPVFRRWPRAFAGRQIELWALNLPGRGARFSEAPLTQMSPLIETMTAEITALQEAPLAFFGHSLGARLAYELACSLRDRALPQPEILFVSACYAPQLLQRAPLHNLPDEEFLAELVALNGIPQEVLAETELIKLLLPMIRADMMVYETAVYQPARPLTMPLVALGGKDDSRVGEQQLAAWSERTNGPFSLQLFQGDHFYLQTAEQALLDVLNQWLKQ